MARSVRTHSPDHPVLETSRERTPDFSKSSDADPGIPRKR
jgi:hypothetical protein